MQIASFFLEGSQNFAWSQNKSDKAVLFLDANKKHMHT